MPFSKISEFEKSFPAVKDLTTVQKEKALDVFNVLINADPDMEEAKALSVAIAQAKKLIVEDEDKEDEEDDQEEVDEEMKCKKEGMQEKEKDLSEKMFQPPAGAVSAAKKALKWKEEHSDEVKGMTSVGWNRARQLASGEKISLDIVKRMSAFNRHRKNAEVDPKYKDEPWKDNGNVAWLGWGGTAGIDWAMSISKNNLSEKIIQGQVELLQGLNDPRFSTIEILKTGKIQDRDLEITEDMLDDFIKHFHENIYGSDIQVNLAHNRDGEAAGWVRNVFKSGDRLLAEIDWTPLGQTKIKNREYRFTSAELALSTVHHKTGEQVDNVLIGIALTNIPAVKGLSSVQLSENVKLFLNSYNNMENLKKLYAELSEKDKITKSEFVKFSEEAEKVEGEEKSEASELKDELEKKIEEEKAPKKTEEEKNKEEEDSEKKAKEEEEKKSEEAKKKEEEKLSSKEKYVSLSEFQMLKEQNTKLQEKIEVQELSELVKNELYLSENNQIGFTSQEQLNEAVGFMKNLSQGQRETFMDLIRKVRTVDFSEIGSSTNFKKKELTQDSVVELAEKIIAEKFSGDTSKIAEAQKMAVKQLSA